MPDEVSLAAIVICALVGYWIISKILNKRAGKIPPRGRQQNKAPPPPQEPRLPQWYDILGIPEFASNEAIIAAYRAKIRAYHPDRVAGLGPEFNELADQKSKEINQAYQTAKQKRNIR
jgi:hypothetical protein